MVFEDCAYFSKSGPRGLRSRGWKHLKLPLLTCLEARELSPLHVGFPMWSACVAWLQLCHWVVMAALNGRYIYIMLFKVVSIKENENLIYLNVTAYFKSIYYKV